MDPSCWLATVTMVVVSQIFAGGTLGCPRLEGASAISPETRVLVLDPGWPGSLRPAGREHQSAGFRCSHGSETSGKSLTLCSFSGNHPSTFLTR